MMIIALSGPSGSGKSTIIKELASEYNVLYEKYIPLNVHSLNNRHILSKWKWIGYWFDNVFEFASKNCKLLITDRSPIDTAAYVDNGETILLPAVKSSLEELSNYGHEFRSILITSDIDILIERIKARIADEPKRLSYHEMDIDFSKRVFDFFTQQKIWQATFNTSRCTLKEATLSVTKSIKELSEY